MPARRHAAKPAGPDVVPAIPVTILLAAEPFGARLGSLQVARLLARGLAQGGREAVDVLAIDASRTPAAALDECGFDERVRRARAVVIAAARLCERTLAGSAPFEIATRARQAGVPAYAVARESELGLFDARLLDLQAVLRARGARSLTAAGSELARLL